MNIAKMILNTGNSLAVDSTTLGALIAKTGHAQLWEERKAPRVDVIVVHYTSAVNVDARKPFDLAVNLKIFCEYGVSSHYLINRRGKIFLLVPEEKKAWHCGGSVMPPPDNRRAVNDFSIGVELMATETSGFTQSQYAALAKLCEEIEVRYQRPFSYVGHEAIAGKEAVRLGLRREPKTDPGALFEWRFFFDLLKHERAKRKR